MPVRGGPDAPLVGRDPEVAMLAAALDEATRGRGGTVVIEGEAGIGKSRLVEDVLDRARARGFAVFCGEAEKLEQARPFGVVVRALGISPATADPAPARIGRLLALGTGELGPLEPVRQDVRFQVVDEIVDLIQSRSSVGPLVVAFEDVQWADPSTLLAVGALARRVAETPTVMVLTLRPTPRPPEVVAMLERLLAAGALHMILRPLVLGAVDALVADRLRAVPGPRLRAEAARGGGNPLWTCELVDALWRDGRIDVVDGQAEVGDIELPASLGLTVLRQLSYLSDDALRLLHVAALLGPSFELRDLSLCLGRPVTDILAVLDEAIRAGILGDAGERLAFRHDLVWEAIYQDLPAAVRKGLHLEVGRALAGAGRPAGQVAGHLGLGASPGDIEAVQWLQRAAREAAPAAPAVAVGLLEQALDLLEPADGCHDEIGAELVAALVRSGHPGRAEALARDILDRGPRDDVAGGLRWGLAEALQMQGRLGDALAEVEAAAGGPGLPEWRRARLLADAAQWRYYTGDSPGARSAAERAIAAGERSGDDIAVCLGLTALSRVAVDELDLAGGISLSRQAVARAGTSPIGRVTDFIHPTFDLGGALVIADQLAEAEDVLRRGRRLRESLGSTWDRPLFTNALAHVQLYRGEWDDAVAEARTVLSMVEEGAARGAVQWTYSLLGYVAVHRGDLEAAGEAGGAATTTRASPTMGSDLLLWCQALGLEARGEMEDAADLLEAAWDLRLPFKIVTWPRMAADAVRVALASGRRARAESVVVALERIADQTGVALYEGVALRCRGLCEDDGASLGKAVDVLGGASRPMELAAAREDAGRHLGRAGRVPDAVALLEQALATYEHLGATSDVSRAEAALREIGVRHGRRGPRPRAKTGWDSLTGTERAVADLAAQGLTNPEIGLRLYISPRTVETHLSHLYRKLGLRSRTELAAEAAGRART